MRGLENVHNVDKIEAVFFEVRQPLFFVPFKPHIEYKHKFCTQSRGVLLLFFFLLPLLSTVRFLGFGFWFLVFAKTCLFSWLTTQINWMENP